MPRGAPKPQTIASKKWNQKAGYRTKAFTLKGELLDSFAAACEKAGRSQASVVAEAMQLFVNEQGEQDGEG